MAMPSYGHEYAAVKLNDTTTYGNDDIFDDDEALDEPIEVPDAPRHSGRKVAAVLSFCALAAVAGSQRYHASSHAELLSESQSSLHASNAYERKRGFALADGELGILVQVHKPTTLALTQDHGYNTLSKHPASHRQLSSKKKSNAKPVVWEVESSPESGDMQTLNGGKAVTSTDFTFTEPGAHKVYAHELALDGSKAATHTFTVVAKIIRYELRDLEDDDREAYFDALHQFYTLGQDEGEALYGSTYKSISFLVREHLYGGADKVCDHWHDDAGILNHHIGVTWTMEQSLRMINPKTAAHYWDYTREGGSDIAWYNSPVFGDQWFGTNSPNNADHVVDTGRFAYTQVMTDAGAFSDIINPYGLLRSPWNTNPVPYLMRSNRTFYGFGDGFSGFPTCSAFKTVLELQSLPQTLYRVNGQLHGPVHLMVGGHWDNNPQWSALGKTGAFDDKFLLLSKWLWRLGYVRTPESCSADTPHEECMPSCPVSYAAPGEIGMTNQSALELLRGAGIFSLSQSEDEWNEYFKAYGEGDGYSLDWLSLFNELCHVGSAGEMFTSSAPQDPLFWPLHGNAERFVMYLRILNQKGAISLDETWGYQHTADVPSDTGLVCDWDAVTDTVGMPKCSRETCPGHKEDDLLPFRHLFAAQGGTLLTNADMYKATSPYSDKLPYMYDSLAHWEGCDGSTLLDSDDDANDMFSVIDTPPPTVTTAATAETSSLMFSVPSGIWGAMRF